MPQLTGQKSDLSKDERWVVDRWKKKWKVFFFLIRTSLWNEKINDHQVEERCVSIQ